MVRFEINKFYHSKMSTKFNVYALESFSASAVYSQVGTLQQVMNYFKHGSVNAPIFDDERFYHAWHLKLR